jgi:ABC-type transport system involved in multi-copper enzyme maturation permease subunit
MNAALVIASRELRDRSRLFVIALAMAIIPFIAGMTPGARSNRPLAIVLVAGFLAVAYSCGVALILGVSTVGRELAERRFSFLLSKPASTNAIWLGKIASALLTSLGAFAIILLPPFVLARRGWVDLASLGGEGLVFGSAIACVVLFFIGHAASSMVRSRSIRVAFDLVLAALALLATFAMLRPILLGGGLDLAKGMLIAIAAAVLIVLAVAPLWQLSQGRIDPKRNHAALSNALWLGVAVVLIGAGAFSYWVVSAPLSSVGETYALDQDPTGRWVFISGLAKKRGSYSASYIVDTVTGEHERVSAPPWGSAHLSGDGRVMVWMENANFNPTTGSYRLITRRLEPGGKQTPSPLVITMSRHAQLSRDGSRIATARYDRLEVYDIATGRLLGAASGISADSIRSMFFVGSDIVRIVDNAGRDGERVMRVLDFDIAKRKLTRNGQRPARLQFGGVNATADGSRLYVRDDATVVDARTGALIAALPIKPEVAAAGAMLSDGSSIVTRDGKLYQFDRNGVLVAEVPLPVRRARVVGSVGSDKILLSAASQDPKQRRMLIVDLAAKKVAVSVAGVMGPLPGWGIDPVLPQFPADATFAGVDASRNVVLWDAGSGARRSFPS